MQRKLARRIYSWYGLALLILALLLALFPRPASADGGAPNLAYVAGGANGVSIIDIAQQRVSGNMKVSGEPQEVVLSLDGRFLYAAQPASGQITALAAKTGQTICSAHLAGSPSLLALDANNNVLYAAGNDAPQVYALDASTCALRQTIHTNGPVYGLSVTQISDESGTHTQVWTSEATALALFDGQGKLNVRIPLPAGPRFLSLPTGSNAAYVTTAQGSIVAVDFATHAVRTLLSGGSYGPMDFDDSTSEVYVPDRLHNQLDVLTPVPADPQPLPREPARVILLSGSPQSVAITSGGQFGFVALNSGKVVMLDIPGHQTVTTINVGGTPHFIITGVYPPLLGTTPGQASIWNTVGTIVAYLFLIVPLLGVFIWLRRRSKKQEASAEQANNTL